MTEPKNIDEVILSLQAELPVLAKDKKGQVGNQKTKYADLVQVNDVVLKRLNAMQTIWTCRPHLEAGSFGLHYSLMHVPSGTEKTGVWPLKLSENPQQMGSATTYGRRYALLAVTGIVAEDEDDDGNGASGERSAQRAAPQRRQSARDAAPTMQDRPQAQRAQRSAGPPPLPGEVEGLTKLQRDKILVMFDKVGIADRTERLDLSSLLVGRALQSANELTKAEARTLIDRLEAASTQDDPLGWLYETAKAPPEPGGAA